ncbi:Superoxide dismutase [Mn], mitochondrial [Rhodotorula kratochvilovae]
MHHDTLHITYVKNLFAVGNVARDITEVKVLQVVKLTSALNIDGGGSSRVMFCPCAPYHGLSAHNPADQPQSLALQPSLFYRNFAPPTLAQLVRHWRRLLMAGVFAEHGKRDSNALEYLQSVVGQVGLAMQGSGWTWRVYSRENQTLKVIQTANQNIPPASQVPLLRRPNNRAGHLCAI